MRIRDPKTTALIFASGKMVVTGAKSEDHSRLASRKYARIIQKLGFDAKFSEFKIQNIVGSCDVKFPIRLEGLAYSHGQFSSYEPEVCLFLSAPAFNIFDFDLPQLFPGLIYRMIKPKVVLLIFVSGKIVLTGAKVGIVVFFDSDTGPYHHLPPVRFERRSTRLSTRSTLSFANSANLERLSIYDVTTFLLGLFTVPFTSGNPRNHAPFPSMPWLHGGGLLTDVCAMLLTVSCPHLLRRRGHVWNISGS